MLRFWSHVEKHYRHADGTPTGEVDGYRLSLRPLRRLYSALPVTEFSPLKLKAVRQAIINADLCRGVINQRVGRVVRMFRWAVEEELVPETVYRALRTVPGLQRGRCEARETDPVRPAPDEWVDAARAYVLPPVRAMIDLQRLTGMRPGEVCSMRACDLDTSGQVWLYRPYRHKTSWRGKSRVVALGPRAQAIIRAFTVPDTQAALFSPARALVERAALLRAVRKTKVQPSQRNRRKPTPRRSPGPWYTPRSYLAAVRRGCDRADQVARQKAEDHKAEVEGRAPVSMDAEVGAADRLVSRWHPNQLRHNHATAVRRKYGLEAAQVALGHSRADVTEIYAERDLTLAVRVAGEVG